MKPGEPNFYKHRKPDVTAQEPEIQTPEPAIKAPLPELPEPKPEVVERKLAIVQWPGAAIPVECPHCGALVLQDRATRACVVEQTRETWDEKDNPCIDREMGCRRCGEKFIARQPFQHRTKKP